MGQAFNFFPFFIAWEGWAQLAFVLGCLFVPVTILGLGVLVHRRIQRRGFEQDTSRPDAERAQMAQRMRDARDAPFGLRAMLQDPEVEGIWNSRASTPLHSPVLGPRSTSPSRNPFSRSRRTSSSSIPKVNITDPKVTPLPAGPRITQIDGAPSLAGICKPSARSSSESSWQSFTPTHAVTLDKTPSTNLSSSSRTTSIGESRTSLMPKHEWIDQSPAVTTPERHGGFLIIGSTSISDDNDLDRTPTTKRALDRMEAHRKFHAAESGQLHPRSKSSSTGCSVHEHAIAKHLLLDSENGRAVSWPITAGEILVNFEASQRVQTMTSPSVVPFRAFVEMHPPPPTKVPPSAWTARTQGLMDEKLQVCQQVPFRKRITISNNESVLTSKSSDDDLVDVAENPSMLGTQTRTINAGFEVLPAGTLEAEQSGRILHVVGHPLGEASNDTSKPRKLRKRSVSQYRRPSVESTYETVAL